VYWLALKLGGVDKRCCREKEKVVGEEYLSVLYTIRVLVHLRLVSRLSLYLELRDSGACDTMLCLCVDFATAHFLS
jgi:hypothetical protein